MIAGVCFSQAAGGNGKADSTAAGALSCSVACSFLVCVSISWMLLCLCVFVRMGTGSLPWLQMLIG